MADLLDEIAPEIAQEDSDELLDEANPQRHFILFQALPAWVISLLVHMLVLLVLGLLSVADPVQIVNVLSASHSGDEGPEIEKFTISELDLGDIAQAEEPAEPVVDLPERFDVSEPLSVDVPMEMAAVPIDMTDLVTEMAPSAATLQSLSSMRSQSFDSRSDSMKKKLLRQYGGSASSEAAVAKALKWIAKHQMPNGAWTFQHNVVRRDSGGDPGDPQRARAFNAATALALLPFLGAGQTHMTGEYKDTVRRGLLFLVANGKPKVIGGMPTLDFSESGGSLYSHGLVTILLTEAFAMTEDPALLGPAQAALNFSFYAQNADGGWRYSPRSLDSDTSVTGWYVMAMKSGYMAHLTVPPLAVRGSVAFLDRVQTDDGAMYRYTERSSDLRPAGCTAIGLLCRMYTGWDKNHPSIKRGVEYLGKVGVDKTDIYYNYYAAQVLRHHGGPEWDKFNVELRDWLVAEQNDSGGAAGSWHFPNSRQHRGPLEGGRLCSTAFATMILEVYYRHMPLYSSSAAEDEFPL